MYVKELSPGDTNVSAMPSSTQKITLKSANIVGLWSMGRTSERLVNQRAGWVPRQPYSGTSATADVPMCLSHPHTEGNSYESEHLLPGHQGHCFQSYTFV